MSHPEPRQHSDDLLDALDALKRTETRRHREPNRSPLFQALAAEADVQRRRIFRIAAEPDPEPAPPVPSKDPPNEP